jgi:hypothetical protein
LQRRPQWFGLAFLLAAVAAALAATVSVSATGGGTSPGSWCGGTRWRLMALSDRDRGRVRLDRIQTSIAEIATLVPPKAIGPRRSSGFERNTWRLQAVIDRYRIASNGEIALVLYDIPSGKYMDAYLPNPHCLGERTRNRAQMLAARRDFTEHCPRVIPGWQLLGASIDVTGVGFWNPVHTTRGALPNGAELRPLTSMHIISGCGT